MANKYNAQQLIYDPLEGIAHTLKGLSKSEKTRLENDPNGIRFDSIFEFQVYCKLIEVFPREFIQIHRELPDSGDTPYKVVSDFVIIDPDSPDYVVSIFEAKGYVTESYPYRMYGYFLNNPIYWEKYHIVCRNPQLLLRRKIFKSFEKKGVYFMSPDVIPKIF